MEAELLPLRRLGSEALGTPEALALAQEVGVEAALAVLLSLTVREGVGVPLRVAVGVIVGVGVPLGVSEAVELAEKETDGVIEGLAPEDKDAVAERLGVELPLRVGDAVPEAVLVAVCVPEPVGV